MSDKLLVHAVQSHSRSNGPGVRSVLWVQGCRLGCKGCFNPSTHSFNAGEFLSVDALLHRFDISDPDIEGLTISGGEPFHQAKMILQLIRQIKNVTTWSVIIFTGYTVDETRKIPYAKEIMLNIDVLLSGRFDRHHPPTRDPFSNKRFSFFNDRYSLLDFQRIPDSEIILSNDGWITRTGSSIFNW